MIYLFYKDFHISLKLLVGFSRTLSLKINFPSNSCKIFEDIDIAKIKPGTARESLLSLMKINAKQKKPVLLLLFC